MRFNGDVLGSVAGMLEVTGDGDTVDVTPVVTSGTKIATIVINEGSPEEESIDLYAPEGFSGDYNDLSNKPDLFSGVYEDLTNKPTLNGNVISGNMFTNNYSTDEQVIGEWIDGKPLYQKTIHKTTTFINNAWNTTFLGTVGSGIKIHDFNGYAKIRGTDQLYNYNYWRSTSEYFTVVTTADCDDLSIYIAFPSNYTLEIGYCTIMYTKNID